MKNPTDYRSAFDFSGKTVLITAGAGTLGPEFAKGFLQHGANVVLADVNTDATQRVAVNLEIGYPGRVLGLVANVADPASVAQMVSSAVARFGRINILVNNAAYSPNHASAFFQKFEDYELRQWRDVMAVNIDGMFLVAQAIGKQMIKQGSGGAIIQTASIYGLLASDSRIYEGSEYLGKPINNPAVYSASKAAVVGFTRWLATYWASHGIRVNAIAPGGVDSGQNETFKARYGDRVPLGRMATTGEITSTVLYLASDASSYVTGQCIAVDGGLSAW